MAQKIKYLAVVTGEAENNFLGFLDAEMNFLRKIKFKAQTSEEFFAKWRQKVKLCTLAKLSGIIVHQGAGTYSGLRLSSVVANSIKIAYPQIKLFSIRAENLKNFLDLIESKKWGKAEKFILPQYPALPSITQPKK